MSEVEETGNVEQEFDFTEDSSVSDPKADRLRRKVEDAEVEGWSIESESNTRVIMIKHDYGSLGAHLVIFILTFWSLGIVNALYAAYRYFAKADKKVIRA